MTARSLRASDVTGHHVGLRAEALALLASGGIPVAERTARDAREKAREWGDEEAVALWSRLLWRHHLRERYAGAARRTLVLA